MADEEDSIVKCVPGAVIHFHWENDSEIYEAQITSRRGHELQIRYLNDGTTDTIELDRSSLKIIEIFEKNGHGKQRQEPKEVELFECDVCAEMREFFTVAPCGHSVCGRCAIKMRWNFDRSPRNQRDRKAVKNSVREDGFRCPVCREETYKNLIICPGKGHQYKDFKLKDLIFDKALHVYFTKYEDRKYFQVIRRYFCPICDQNIKKKFPRAQWKSRQLKLKGFYTLGKLNYHLKKEHRNIFLCDVCLKHSKVFLDEAEIFQGKSNLIKHKKKGDVVVKGKRLPRHPKCNFCGERGTEFFDSEAFLSHMRNKHFSCPFCEGETLTFYSERSSLKSHFLSKHFLCEWCSEEKNGEEVELIAFQHMLDFKQHRRAFHFDLLDKAEKKGNININHLLGGRNEEIVIEGDGVQEYCLPCYDLRRQTAFSAQEVQKQQWDVQAKIEQERHGRDIQSILGDRRIRSIPDYKEEEVGEREFRLHETVMKTFKDKTKIEYHQLTYDCYRVGELSAARFFKSFRMLWNPGNEMNTWMEPLMLIISIDSNAQRRRDLYECYKAWMKDRNADDHVKIWHFPEYEGLDEIPPFQLLQMQLRRIKEKDQFPDLVEVKYANQSTRGVWKKDPTLGRGRGGPYRRGRPRSPNPRPMQPPGRRNPPPNFGPVRGGYAPNRGGLQPAFGGRTKRSRPAVPTRDFPALPARSSPSKRTKSPQPAPRSLPPKNIIPRPQQRKTEPSPKMEQPKPQTQTKENRIIHESTEPKPAGRAIESISEKFADIDLVGITKPTKWDAMITKLCRSSLKVLSDLTASKKNLILKIDSVALEDLADNILRKSPQIENVLHHTNIGVFGMNLSSRIDLIRCYSSENEYEAAWVEESLRQIDADVLYTYAYFLYHARTKCIELRKKKAKTMPASGPEKKKKTKKKKKKTKMSLAAFHR